MTFDFQPSFYLSIVASVALALPACGGDSKAEHADAGPGAPDSGSLPVPDAGDANTGFFTRHPGNPVINLRDLTSPTSNTNNMVGTMDPCVLWDESESLWRAYWSFWDVHAEENGLPAAGIYGATSTDGIHFVPLEQLALDQLGSFDSDSTETCDVIKVPDGPGQNTPKGGVYYMYFSGNDDESDGHHKMGLALSLDGEHFAPISAVDSPKGIEGLLFSVDDLLEGEDLVGNFVTDPTVLLTDEGFSMWSLCVLQIPSPNGGICYSTSVDGIHWEHHGLVNGLERGFPIQPTVFYNPQEDRLDMYVVMDTLAEEGLRHDYDTNLDLRVKGFFHATSADGMNWTEVSQERIFEEDLSLTSEDRGLATGADAEVKDGIVYFFYPSFTTLGGSVFGSLLNWPLNLATGQL